MGVGNYLLRDAKTIYIDDESVYGAWDREKEQFEFVECEFDYQFLYDCMIEHILELLPKSYMPVKRKFHGERRVIAANGFYDISVVDWQGYLALNVELKEADEFDPWEYHPLAVYHHEKAATRIFDSLYHCGLQLSQRSSGWTSSRYQPAMAA